MSVRIERVVTGEDQVILHISGRITADDVGMLDDLLRQEMRTVVVDLKDVDLVDREVVKFFALSESNGTDLRNCPAYVREWVMRERVGTDADGSRPKAAVQDNILDG
jgi:hypothetical protein